MGTQAFRCHHRRQSLWIATALLFVGCATYQIGVDPARKMMASGDAISAAAQLREKANTPGDDQVVHLLDYATALQAAGQYQESIEAFLKAEDLTQVQDYHSLSRITGSLLFNEGMVQYKGEDYEKVFINAMLALNFLSLGDLEAAQVECRKLNDKLYKYRFEAKRDYEQNPFAFYLSAMIWEESKNWDSAYIDFKRAYELAPQLKSIRKDLLRSSRRANRLDEWKKWQEQFPDMSWNPKVDSKKGEVVLIHMQGWAPRKRPDELNPRLPRLMPVPSRTAFSELRIAGHPPIRTEVVSSVEEVAMKAFRDAYEALVAKRMAGIATKAVVTEQVRQKDEGLGQILWLLMNISDQADLRQWSTLPGSFQVAKTTLEPGEYEVSVEGFDNFGAPSGEVLPTRKIQVRAGKRHFVVWRSY